MQRSAAGSRKFSRHDQASALLTGLLLLMLRRHSGTAGQEQYHSRAARCALLHPTTRLSIGVLPTPLPQGHCWPGAVPQPGAHVLPRRGGGHCGV